MGVINMKNVKLDFDVVVVGGGLAGMCAAVASARHGAKTALVHNRPTLGGNASSEIRMHICGADHHANVPNARETGLVEEFCLENKFRNEHHSWAIWDSVLWEKCAFQENLSLFLNTHMTDAKMGEDGNIREIYATELTSETNYTMSGKIFIEATGDGTLAALAGAEIMQGREAVSDFNEPNGQEVADHYTMGNSLMFSARDMGKPVKFIKPEFAYSYTDEDLAYRDHSDPSSGYWWIELGGGKLDTIDDAQEIRDELLKVIYGVWDHIKNNDSNAENYELDWVGMLPGKRENRRIVGDYILNENDLMNNTHFEDAVAYGGWPMDCHVIEGFLTHSNEPTKYIHMHDVYEIPYRTMCCKNVDNLMLAGRSVSTTHMAFASTRVMATLGVMGQAAGVAAAMAIADNALPKSIYNKMSELQQALLKDDCYIPNVKNEDSNDKALTATVSATSEREGYEAVNVINGVSRTVKENSNLYVSNGVSPDGEALTLKLKNEAEVSSVHFKFDSNLSKEIMISLNGWVKSKQLPSAPPELVRDFDIELYKDGEILCKKEIRDNHMRHRIIDVEPTVCDTVKARFYKTNGCEDIRVFEMRIY